RYKGIVPGSDRKRHPEQIGMKRFLYLGNLSESSVLVFVYQCRFIGRVNDPVLSDAKSFVHVRQRLCYWRSKTKMSFLLEMTMSSAPTPVISSTTRFKPEPESLSISWGTKYGSFPGVNSNQ